MSIEGMDLNLLRVLQAVARERNVSAAARKLGLSQPAVSSAIKRLRVAFEDPIMVRVKGGVQLTPRAVSLANAIDEALAIIARKSPSDRSFDPSDGSPAFSILMSDIGEAIAGPDIARKVALTNANIRLSLRQSTERSYAAELADGRADVLFGYLDRPSPSLVSTSLYSTPLVCVYGKDHAFSAKTVSGTDYFSVRHVVCQRERFNRLVLSSIETDDEKRKISLVVSHHSSMPAILAGSHLVATISEGLAEKWAQFLSIYISKWDSGSFCERVALQLRLSCSESQLKCNVLAAMRMPLLFPRQASRIRCFRR